MNGITTYWNNLTSTERFFVLAGGALAVIATGGAVAYAVAGSEALLVIAGPVLIATGEAAKEVAKRV